MSRFTEKWRNAWRIRAFKDQLFISCAGLLVAFILLIVFLNYGETRTGAVLHDPFLSLFSPVDSRWVIYTVYYSGLVLGIASLGSYPFSLLLAMRAFVLLILLRIACAFFLPLDPPADNIRLVDPFLRMPGVRPVLTRDLFFSWHTAALTLFVLSTRWKDMKLVLACTAIIVSLLLLLQHVHYTIDVIAAPCFAYVAFGIAKSITVEEMVGLQGPGRTGGPTAPKG